MRKVYQDRFGYGEGNCAWACISTLFDIPLDDLRHPPPCAEDLLRWTQEYMPHLEYHHIDLGRNFRLVEGYDYVEGVGTERWTYDLPDAWDPPVEGYWLASINSLGLKRPVEDPYYPMPALHMVVMRGRELFHDPNAQYADYEPTVVMQTWWTP